jgi:hypothetical protein
VRGCLDRVQQRLNFAFSPRAGTRTKRVRFPRMVKRYHWGFDDPVKATGSEEEVFAVFRRVRDARGILGLIYSRTKRAFPTSVFSQPRSLILGQATSR